MLADITIIAVPATARLRLRSTGIVLRAEDDSNGTQADLIACPIQALGKWQLIVSEHD